MNWTWCLSLGFHSGLLLGLHQGFANWINFLVLDWWDAASPLGLVAIFTKNPINHNLIVPIIAGIIRGLVSLAFENSWLEVNTLPIVIDRWWKECEAQGWAGYLFSMKLKFLKSKLIAEQTSCPMVCLGSSSWQYPYDGAIMLSILRCLVLEFILVIECPISILLQVSKYELKQLYDPLFYSETNWGVVK